MRSKPLHFAILFLAVFIGIYTYTASGLTSLWPAHASGVQTVFWGFHGLLIGLIFLGFGHVRKGNKAPSWMTFAANSMLALFVAQLVFAVFIFIGDLGNWANQYLEIYTNSNLQRSRGWLLSALVTAAIPLLAFAYGTTKGKYRYTIKKQDLFFKDLPAAFDGFTLTQISDVHAGSFTSKEAVEKGIAKIQALKSDLFVFTGDLVNNTAREFDPWVSSFSKIKAPYGQFSILGNHDYGDYARWPNSLAKTENLEQLKKRHAETGFRLLLDENIALEKDGQKLHLLGIQNWGVGFSQYGNFDKTRQGVPDDAFKILLSHDPSHFEAQVKTHPSKMQLTLSGHTHGMQFGIEIFGFKWSPVQYRYPRWAGLYEENGRYLYVNRGFGFLGFSGRIGIWPEITQITLHKASA